MTYEREPYRTLTVNASQETPHHDFKQAVWKETYEGPMQSFDGSPFEPAFFSLQHILDWLEMGGGKYNGYTWEVTS